MPQSPAPKTTNFFEVYPEEIMFGASYDWYNPYGVKSSWVVANSNHWIYAGTGLTESAQIPNLIGFEWDRPHLLPPARPAVVVGVRPVLVLV